MAGVLTMEGQAGDTATLVDINGVPRPVALVAGTSGPVDASAVTYTPADPTAWPIPLPSTVADALDLLAAVRGSFFRNVTRAPFSGEAQTSTIGPFNVTPTKSGVYLAWSCVELQIPVAAAAAQAELTILVDSVAQGVAIGSSYTVGLASIVLSQLALVSVNRTLPHNWELAVTTSAPTSPGHIDADSGKLLLLEL